MPTILRAGPYRFYFYSHESNEPAHIHVDRDNASAKYWISPVVLARNIGFSLSELNTVEKLVNDKRFVLKEAWDGYFGTSF